MIYLYMFKMKPLKTAGFESRESAFIRPWRTRDGQLLNESVGPSRVLEWLLALYSFLEGSLIYFWSCTDFYSGCRCSRWLPLNGGTAGGCCWPPLTCTFKESPWTYQPGLKQSHLHSQCPSWTEHGITEISPCSPLCTCLIIRKHLCEVGSFGMKCLEKRCMIHSAMFVN